MPKKRKVEIEDKIVGVVDGGTTLSEKHTIVCRFRDFENCDETTGSPEFKCYGYWWQLELHPGRTSYSDDEVDENVTLYLIMRRTSDATHVKARCGFRFGEWALEPIDHTFSRSFPSFCLDNFESREEVLDCNHSFLMDGALEVKVDIQVHQKIREYEVPPKAQLPEKSLHLDLLKMLQNGSRSDVTFKVGDQTFQAHLCVLEVRAPLLANFAEDAQKNEVVQIDGVDPSLFEAMLHFIYSDTLPDTMDLKSRAIGIIEVANRFEILALKALAEAEIIASGVAADVAADLFVEADRLDCTTLKDAAVQVFLDNKKAVMDSEGYSKIQESLKYSTELLNACAMSDKKR